jgi:hypothetical protein
MFRVQFLVYIRYLLEILMILYLRIYSIIIVLT